MNRNYAVFLLFELSTDKTENNMSNIDTLIQEAQLLGIDISQNSSEQIQELIRLYNVCCRLHYEPTIAERNNMEIMNNLIQTRYQILKTEYQELVNCAAQFNLNVEEKKLNMSHIKVLLDLHHQLQSHNVSIIEDQKYNVKYLENCLKEHLQQEELTNFGIDYKELSNEAITNLWKLVKEATELNIHITDEDRNDVSLLQQKINEYRSEKEKLLNIAKQWYLDLEDYDVSEIEEIIDCNKIVDEYEITMTIEERKNVIVLRDVVDTIAKAVSLNTIIVPNDLNQTKEYIFRQIEVQERENELRREKNEKLILVDILMQNGLHFYVYLVKIVVIYVIHLNLSKR